MEAAGRADRKIQPKDVLRRVASRRRQNRPTPMQREKGAAQLALWGGRGRKTPGGKARRAWRSEPHGRALLLSGHGADCSA